MTCQNVELGEQDLRFNVDQVGVPVLVKISYFPNWEVERRRGPVPHRAQPDGRGAHLERRPPDVRPVDPRLRRLPLTFARHRPAASSCWVRRRRATHRPAHRTRSATRCRSAIGCRRLATTRTRQPRSTPSARPIAHAVRAGKRRRRRRGSTAADELAIVETPRPARPPPADDTARTTPRPALADG